MYSTAELTLAGLLDVETRFGSCKAIAMSRLLPKNASAEQVLAADSEGK